MLGDARLAGHRIAVYHIVQYHDSGFEIPDIAAEFDISEDLVEEALEYAKHNPEEADKARQSAEI